ncbi:hypothetical protein [Candidatus Thiosymbion oneisti]|uniref:hypothetical protein n=1 Tax=Candidatus Thiosymbion oneisti TaxID=589554 RepID=UPI000B7F4A19|nr:hypothetical protein [Candidatus Thiosymbion oneisti]
MINPLEWFRIRFPYVWRLQPHVVIPLVLLINRTLPAFGLLQWNAPDLKGVEQLLEMLDSVTQTSRFLIGFILFPWIRKLIAFPLNNAGWRRILLTLLFYWAVIAYAFFLGPELAIDRGLRARHKDIPDVPAVRKDLDRLRALCDVVPGSEPSSDLLEIFTHRYGSVDRPAAFRPLYLMRDPGEDQLRGYKTRDRQEFSGYYDEPELQRLLELCKPEHFDDFYEIREFSAFLFQIEGKSIKEALQTTSDLIGGLAAVVELANYVKSGEGPFKEYTSYPYPRYIYFGICLLAAVGLLLVTEWIGRGSLRLGLFARRLRDRLSRLALSMSAFRMACSKPVVVWFLGPFTLLCITFLITFALDQLHYAPIFTAGDGEARDTIQNPFTAISLLYYILLFGLFVLYKPIKGARFSNFWKNYLYTTLAATHFFLFCGAGTLGILLAHETWSHLHGFSNLSDLQIVRRTVDFDDPNWLAIFVILILFAIGPVMAATTRMAYLTGGFRMMASTFMTIIVAPIALFIFLLPIESLLSQYGKHALWLGVGGLAAVLRWYPVQRVSKPAAYGIFLGVLASGSLACGIGILALYGSEITAILEAWSWYGNLGVGLHITIAISILIPILLSPLYLVILPTLSLGLKRVTCAMATPR